MKLNCELIACSDVEHLQQIYTGFSILHRTGFLKLKQTIPGEFLQNKNDPHRWVDYKFFNTKVIINEKIKICYDTHDWNWIDKKILHEVDFYFKRSYDEKFISQLREKNKVFPLGLNYSVLSFEADSYKLRRAVFYRGIDKIKATAKALKLNDLTASKWGGGRKS